MNHKIAWSQKDNSTTCNSAWLDYTEAVQILGVAGYVILFAQPKQNCYYDFWTSYSLQHSIKNNPGQALAFLMEQCNIQRIKQEEGQWINWFVDTATTNKKSYTAFLLPFGSIPHFSPPLIRCKCAVSGKENAEKIITLCLNQLVCS